ncbi:hypothetical protein [Planotetraspora kaengkrachanensis]|uniref:Uncharacterized protein n=1 Tax=Planotetraspora kaengkrachanensis TaxID=575193 RepID=A0A8J3LQV3_9ACTN|nr:hypothetical protein [Planotetraspora kaengkrachanensis]GIG77558.1 hypothetical protein Pka01_06850 [Planotetraspora kaengkrachanensis]
MRDAGQGKAPIPAPARWGLVIAAMCAGSDIAVSVHRLPSGSVTPAVVLGLAVLTLAAIPAAWRGAVWARNTVVSAQALTAVTGVPAFVLPAVPPLDVVISAARLGVAVAVAALLLTAQPIT